MTFSPPETVSRKRLKKTHPDYDERVHALRFYRESHDGTGGYAPYIADVRVSDTMPDDLKAGSLTEESDRRTHLFRHPREKAKFERRVMMAYLTNVIRRVLTMLVGYLTKTQPSYSDYPKAVTDWMSYSTAAGVTWEDFKISEIVPRLCYYGILPVVTFRMPTPDAVTEAQQEDAGGRLQAQWINPEAIVDWRFGVDDQFDWLHYLEEVDLTGPEDDEPRVVTRHWWLAREGYYYVDDLDKRLQDVPVTAWGEYPNGLPIVVWRIGSNGRSLIADACATQRELFNVNSLIQEQERETTFAMLAAPEDGGTQNRGTRKVGSDNVWYYPSESRVPPHWMAPPPHILEHFMSKRETLCKEILEDMGLDFDSTGGNTGMAFQFAMSKIVRLLNVLATSLQRGEAQTMERVGIELGSPLPDTARCVWPSEFDAKDAEKIMDGLERILDRVKSASFRVEAQVRMAAAGMSDLDETIREKGRKEIEQAEQEEQAAHDAGADEQPDDDLLALQGGPEEEDIGEGDGSPDGQAH